MERPKRSLLALVAALLTIFCCGLVRQRVPGIEAAAASPPTYRSDAPRTSYSANLGPSSPALVAVSRPARNFSAASDLYAFVYDLKPAADAGDAEAMWFVYRAHEYCFAYAMSPSGYARDTETSVAALEPSARPHFARARALVSSRCRGFSARRIDLLQMRQEMLESARAGNAAAKATAIAYKNALPSAQRIPDSDIDIARLVSDVRRSRNPEAFLALSLLMGAVAQGRQEAFGDISGNEVAAQSWALAACRLGMDCSASSPIITQYCANAMVCGYPHLEQLVLGALLPPADAKKIESNIRKISL